MSSKEVHILERIAQVIENLPSEHLLHQAKTKEQTDEWHNMRRGNSIIAECWRAKCIKGHGDPIAQALDKEEIDKLKYEGIWLLIEHYKALWDIVQAAEPYVKTLHGFLQHIWLLAKLFSLPLPKEFVKAFENILKIKYPFQSSYELFKEILIETENDRFSECLKPYQEISINKGEAGFKQVTEFVDKGISEGSYPLLNPIETQALKNNFSWYNFTVSWMPMTLMAAQLALLAQLKPSLRDKLAKFNGLTVEMCKLGATACRKRPSKTWPKVRSYVWINGKKIYADRAGGVYR